MPTNFFIGNYPIFERVFPRTDPEGYSHVNALIQATCCRVAGYGEDSLCATARDLLNADSYQLLHPEDGVVPVRTVIFRFSFGGRSGSLIAFASPRNPRFAREFCAMSSYSNLTLYHTRARTMHDLARFISSVEASFPEAERQEVLRRASRFGTGATYPRVIVTGHNVGAVMAARLMVQDINQASDQADVLGRLYGQCCIFGSPLYGSDIFHRWLTDAIGISNYVIRDDPFTALPSANGTQLVRVGGALVTRPALEGIEQSPVINQLSTAEPPVGLATAAMRTYISNQLAREFLTDFNVWPRQTLIQEYIARLFGVVQAPERSGIVADLQAWNAALDAADGSHGGGGGDWGTDPPLIVSGNVAPLRPAPVNPSGTAISGSTPVPARVGGQVLGNVINAIERGVNKIRGYDRELGTSIVSAINNLRHRDGQTYMGNPPPRRGKQLVIDPNNDDVDNAFGIVESYIRNLLDQTNVERP